MIYKVVLGLCAIDTRILFVILGTKKSSCTTKYWLEETIQQMNTRWKAASLRYDISGRLMAVLSGPDDPTSTSE